MRSKVGLAVLSLVLVVLIIANAASKPDTSVREPDNGSDTDMRQMALIVALIVSGVLMSVPNGTNKTRQS